MHQFLDQLLNNPTKKRTQTQTNTQILNKISQQQRFNQLLDLQRKDSQPILANPSHTPNYQLPPQTMSYETNWKQPQDESSEYKVEQITEQIVFNDDSPKITSNNFRDFLPKVKESSLQASRPQEEQVPESQVSVDQDYRINNTKVSPYQHASNRHHWQQPQNDQISKKPVSLNTRAMEILLNDLNSAKESQMQLVNWFLLQKQCFSEYIELMMAKMQLQIKKTMASNQIKQQQQLRQQLSSQIRQQLESSYQMTPTPNPSLLSGKQQSSMSIQRRWQMQKKLIKQELQERYQYRMEKLEQQLEEQRKYSQELIKTYQQTHDNKSTHSSVGGRDRVRSEDELLKVRKLLEEKQRAVSQLEMEIEKLNQHIFDVQQQVQGIELQVQNRVRQKVKLLQAQHQKSLQQLRTHQPAIQYLPVHELNPILESSSHLQQSSRLFGLQSAHQLSPNNHLHQQITQLQLQNQHFKKIILQIEEEKTVIEQQLKEQIKIVAFREEQVKKNEEDITYEWSEVDKQRQSVMNREQQLATAEQNISQKISSIRSQQIHLNQWQTSLQKRQLSLDLRQHQINQKLQQVVHLTNLNKQHQNIYKEHHIHTSKDNFTRNERQSINSANHNRLSRNNIHDFNTEGGGSFRPNGVDIPELPIGKRHQEHQFAKHQKSYDYDLPHRHKPHEAIAKTKTNFEKSFEDPDRSHTRQNQSRERNIITSTNSRSNRPNPNHHQFVLPQTSKPQRHSRSKSRSKQKQMIRNNLNGSSSISTTTYKNPSFKGKYIDDYYQNKQSSNLDGLGSKLQRLRDEIKREIDSIK